jgi:hypothetical protein
VTSGYLSGDLSGSLSRRTIQSPAAVLGANCALWFESSFGTGPGPDVTTWVNRVPNGDAIQAPNPDPAVLVPSAFGRHPGVSFPTVGAGLELHPITPWAIGDRPYFWCRARLDALLHAPNDFQTLFQALRDPNGGTSQSEFDAEASGTFDANSYWNSLSGGTGGGGAERETFITITPPGGDAALLGTHTIQLACQQGGCLVIDGVSTDADANVGSYSNAVNRLGIGRNVGGLSGPSHWSIGVLVASYTQPTVEQIAEVKAYCDAYGFV